MKSHFPQNKTSNGSHNHSGVILEVNKLIQYLLFMIIEENEVS